jgi:hypothetical protein
MSTTTYERMLYLVGSEDGTYRVQSRAARGFDWRDESERGLSRDAAMLELGAVSERTGWPQCVGGNISLVSRFLG